MTVNDINQSLISAMELLAQKYDSELDTTLTIEATITATLDSSIGAYSVNYMGSTFTAYANNTNITYTKDDKVYVLVPNGDFTKDKFILGYPTTVVKDDINNPLIEIGGDFLDLPTNISFCTYDKERYPLVDLMSKDRREYRLALTNHTFYKQVIQDYFDKYGVLKFSCKIKNNIYPEADSTTRKIDGNYGITLAIKYWPYEQLDRNENTLITKYATIDINNILGNPYDQTIYSTQSIIIDDIPKGATIALDYNALEISYFVENFSQVLPSEEGFILNADGNIETLKDDLFIKDIQLKAVSALPDEKLSGYSVQLKSSNGNFLTANSSSYYCTDGTLTKVISAEEYNQLAAVDKEKYHSRYEYTVLSPVIKRKGKEVLKSDIPCYWFIEDSSVSTINNEYYSSYGGLGWRILNPIKDAEASLYDTKTLKFTVGLADRRVDYYDKVTSTSKYKCVLIYDKTIIEDEITIKNIDSNLLVSIESVTGSNKVIANVGTAHLKCIVNKPGSYSYNWARYNSSGTYIETLVGTNEVKIPAIYIDTMNTIKCTVYENGAYVGSASINIIVDSSVDYIVTIKNSDVLYKYDSDGDSPMSNKYDGNAGSAISSIAPLTLNIYRADGVELIEEEYKRVNVTWTLPVNSLMIFGDEVKKELDNTGNHYIYKTNGWSSHTIGINYLIANSYKTSAMDNSVSVTIDFDGSQITQTSSLLFLKDGEDGTNGTSYSAAITYLGLSNKVLASDGTPHRFQIYTDGTTFKYINYLSFNKDNIGLFDFYNETTSASDSENVRKEKRIVLNSSKGFDVLVYNDGRDITSTEGEEYEISKWAIVNYSSTSPKTLVSVAEDTCDGSKYSYLKINSENFGNKNNCAILQVQVKIKNTREYIYAYYPIEVIVLKSFSTTPNRYYFLNGYTSVMYAADGSSPKYYNSGYFSFYSNNGEKSTSLNLDLTKENLLEVNGALKSSKKKIDDTTYHYQATPIINYSGEINNYLAYTLGDIKYYIPVYCYYDTAGYNNMIIWDGSSISVDNNAKIISSQVISGNNDSNGFTGLTIGVVESGSSLNKQSKNGLMSFQGGHQTSYFSADTGAIYLGANNEIALSVPKANSIDNEVENTICGWTASSNALYDTFGTNATAAFYSADAKQTDKYQVAKNAEETSHVDAVKATNGINKTIISYDGTFYTNSGNIGGWIVTPTSIMSPNGSIVLDSLNNKIIGISTTITNEDGEVVIDLQPILDRVSELEAKVRALENTTPGGGGSNVSTEVVGEELVIKMK